MILVNIVLYSTPSTSLIPLHDTARVSLLTLVAFGLLSAPVYSGGKCGHTAALNYVVPRPSLADGTHSTVTKSCQKPTALHEYSPRKALASFVFTFCRDRLQFTNETKTEVDRSVLALSNSTRMTCHSTQVLHSRRWCIRAKTRQHPDSQQTQIAKIGSKTEEKTTKRRIIVSPGPQRDRLQTSKRDVASSSQPRRSERRPASSLPTSGAERDKWRQHPSKSQMACLCRRLLQQCELMMTRRVNKAPSHATSTK